MKVVELTKHQFRILHCTTGKYNRTQTARKSYSL